MVQCTMVKTMVLRKQLSNYTENYLTLITKEKTWTITNNLKILINYDKNLW